MTKEELADEAWLRRVADLSGRSYEETRVVVLEFLETDLFHLSREQFDSFLDPLIESWDIDLATFGMEIVLNRRLKPPPGHPRRFEFMEREGSRPLGDVEPGLKAFSGHPRP